MIVGRRALPPISLCTIPNPMWTSFTTIRKRKQYRAERKYNRRFLRGWAASSESSAVNVAQGQEPPPQAFLVRSIRGFNSPEAHAVIIELNKKCSIEIFSILETRIRPPKVKEIEEKFEKTGVSVIMAIWFPLRS